jgi:hypothetical protein
MTAAEIEALAKIAYVAYGAFTLPFEDMPAAERERWRAVARAMVRALSP